MVHLGKFSTRHHKIEVGDA